MSAKLTAPPAAPFMRWSCARRQFMQRHSAQVCLGSDKRAYTSVEKLVSVAKEQGVVAVHPGCAFFFLVPAHALCFSTTCILFAPLVTPDLVMGWCAAQSLEFRQNCISQHALVCAEPYTAGRQKQLSSWARMQQAVLRFQSCSGVAGMASCRRTLSLRRRWRRRGSPSWARRRPPWSSSASSTRRVPSPRTPKCAVTFSWGADHQQQRNQMRWQITEQHLEGASAALFGRAGRQLWQCTLPTRAAGPSGPLPQEQNRSECLLHVSQKPVLLGSGLLASTAEARPLSVLEIQCHPTWCSATGAQMPFCVSDRCRYCRAAAC